MVTLGPGPEGGGGGTTDDSDDSGGDGEAFAPSPSTESGRDDPTGDVQRQAGGEPDTDPSPGGGGVGGGEAFAPSPSTESGRTDPTGDVGRQEAGGFGEPEGTGIESGTTPGGADVTPGLQEQASQFEQDLVAEHEYIRSPDDVNIRFRDGRLEAEFTQPGRRRIRDVQRREFAASVDERTDVDVGALDITVDDEGFGLTDEAYEDVVAEEVREEYPGLELGRDFTVDLMDGEADVRFTEEFFERELTEELDIAAEAGEDFTIIDDDGTQRVELTAEGRQDAITSSLLTEGQIVTDPDTETVAGFTIGAGEGDVTEVTSAEQLVFDDGGNLVDVRPPEPTTFLGGLEAGAGDVSSDLYEGFAAPFGDAVSDVFAATGRGRLITDPVAGSTAPEAREEAIEGGYVEATLDLGRGESGQFAQTLGEFVTGEDLPDPEPDVAEETSAQQAIGGFTTGAASIPGMAVSAIPSLAYAGEQAGQLAAEEVREEGAVGGAVSTAQAGGEAAVGVAEDVAIQTVRNPAETAGALVGSGAAFRAARAAGPRTSLATRAAIQPGEELLGYGGFGATRAIAGTGAAQRLFPNREPLIFSEEAAIRGAQRVGGGIRTGAGAVSRQLGRGAAIAPDVRRALPRVEVEAGRGVSRGPVEVNVRSGLVDNAISLERRASDLETRIRNQRREIGRFLEAEARGGEYTPIDIGNVLAEPFVRGGRGVQRGARGIRRGFSRGVEGIRGLEIEADAFQARGAEGLGELVEETRSARRDVRDQPSLRRRLSAERRGDIDTGEPGFFFDTESVELGAIDPVEPFIAGAERATSAAGSIRAGFSRGVEGIRGLEIEADAFQARGAEGLGDLVEESRSARRDVRDAPSLRERVDAELRGDVDTGEPGFFFDTESVELGAIDPVEPFIAGAERAAGAVRGLREFGIRVDVGRPGRQLRASELDIDRPVGVEFEGEFDTEADPFEPPADFDQPPARAEFGGRPDAPALEFETESGVAVQRIIGEPRAEFEAESERGPIRSELPFRTEFGQRDTQPEVVGPDVLDSLGFETPQVETPRERVDIFGELEGEFEREGEAEAEAEAESEFRARLGLEQEVERETEFEFEREFEAESEYEFERFDTRDADDGYDFAPLDYDAEDIITDFRDPLTGEVIETDRDPGVLF